MPALPAQPLAALQTFLGYTFKDASLLELAVTHPSFLQDHPETGESNQRLEFLGDAVLQLVITEALYNLFPDDREGSLSKRRSSLARGVFLSELAGRIGLKACLKLSLSEEQTGGRNRASALEDAFEALIGAMYLDSDLAVTQRVLLALYGSLPEQLAEMQPSENPKGQLQELVQPVHGNHAIRYEVIATLGQDHAREYDVQVFFNDQPVGIGRGRSKKAAEEEAAHVALAKLRAEALVSVAPRPAE